MATLETLPRDVVLHILRFAFFPTSTPLPRKRRVQRNSSFVVGSRRTPWSATAQVADSTVGLSDRSTENVTEMLNALETTITTRAPDARVSRRYDGRQDTERLRDDE